MDLAVLALTVKTDTSPCRMTTMCGTVHPSSFATQMTVQRTLHGASRCAPSVAQNPSSKPLANPHDTCTSRPLCLVTPRALSRLQHLPLRIPSNMFWIFLVHPPRNPRESSSARVAMHGCSVSGQEPPNENTTDTLSKNPEPPCGRQNACAFFH